MKKIFVSILFFLLCVPVLQAQVVGTVRDAHGMYLPGAVVRSLSCGHSATTDAHGHFKVEHAARGAKMVATFVGLSPDTLEVTADSLHFVLHELETDLGEAQVVGRRAHTLRTFSSLENRETITRAGLYRDACCNLGESFQSNPSVDVSYSDAATGAKQIKLLGLSGSYVQMLTENIPNFRGVAAPYGLGYIPGTWMEGIQISKGISSVKNGYEAMTGQINVEYKKPQQHEPDLLFVNLYGDSDTRLEGNADATFHIGKRWGTTLLAHYDKSLKMHDSNDDGFADMPKTQQYNFMNRWNYQGERYAFQAGVKFLAEDRESGQVEHGGVALQNPYNINIDTRRYEAFTKNSYTFDQEHGTNMALILSASWHDQDALYGARIFDVKQQNTYASLLFETQFDHHHSLSAGLSFNHDGFRRHYRLEHNASLPLENNKEHENVGGAYVQYTMNLHDKFVLMAGLRGDYSDLHKFFVTPRAHLKYTPNDFVNFRLSAGKGYRTARPMDEQNYLFAGSRRVEIAPDLKQEEAWNTGANAQFKIPLGDRLLNLNMEYYYTHFVEQVVTDMDADAHAVRFYNLDGRSYSHVLQAEATMMVVDGLELTAAYRYTDAKCTIDGSLREKPLTSRYKALFTASYKTPNNLWQMDATLQLNGGGRMPDPYTLADGSLSWEKRYDAFPQLSAQVSRKFGQFTVYVGGENLTNYKQKMPIIDAGNPWGDNFDPTMVYAPVHGFKIYAGLRFNLPHKHHHH